MHLNEVCGLVGYPCVGIVGEFYVEPAGAAFEEVKFCAGVERLLETGSIVLAVALAGDDLVGGDDTAKTEVRKQSVNKTVITIITVAGGERPNHTVRVRVMQQAAKKMQVRANFVFREKS